MMKFGLIWFLILIIAGCSVRGSSSDIPLSDSDRNTNGPDYEQMVVQGVNKKSVTFAPQVTDPEASYPVFEMNINAETVFVGGDINNRSLINVWAHEEVVTKIEVHQ